MGKRLSIEDRKSGCISCLNYFGIFSYPLTHEEVFLFNPVRCSLDETGKALSELVQDNKIYQHEKYYLPENKTGWISERDAGNKRANELLHKVGRYAAVIAAFPFVEGIAISGSLSKNYASQFPDIDYFIITRANRLWIARTLLHLFKKLTFITGHQHYFCMNYFIDRGALLIKHRNIYSAIEVNTLKPVLNEKLFIDFQQANAWTEDFQPNHPGISDYSFMLRERQRLLKKMLEMMIGIMAPEKMNRWLMNITDSKWRKKWRHSGYTEEEYNKAFLTELHVSKNHPMDYEKKVMAKLNKPAEEAIS